MRCTCRQYLFSHNSIFVSHLLCFSSKLPFFFPIFKRVRKENYHAWEISIISFCIFGQLPSTTPSIAARHPSLPFPVPPRTAPKKETANEKIFWRVGKMPGLNCVVFCAEQQRGAAEQCLSSCIKAAQSSHQRSPQTGSLVLGRC